MSLQDFLNAKHGQRLSGFFSTTKQVNLLGSLNQDLNALDNLPLSKCNLLCSPGSWPQLNLGVPDKGCLSDKSTAALG